MVMGIHAQAVPVERHAVLRSYHARLGSDYPFDMAEPEPVKAVEALESLTRAEKDAILFKNAERLLGMQSAE